MRAGGRYGVGLAALAAAALVVGLALSREARPGHWAASGAALVVQGPLGWWLVRSVGSRHFFPVWAAGLASRLALVALFGFVLIPARAWPLGPTLFSLVGWLISLLVVEAVVVLVGRSEPEVR